MFILFFNLYYAMFTGTWYNYSWYWLANDSRLIPMLNAVGKFITSIFGDEQMTDLGDQLIDLGIGQGFLLLIAVVLATITSIGIVVVATKGIKKLFTVFFYGVR